MKCLLDQSLANRAVANGVRSTNLAGKLGNGRSLLAGKMRGTSSHRLNRSPATGDRVASAGFRPRYAPIGMWPGWFLTWSKEVGSRSLVSELFPQGSVGAAGDCCLYPVTRIAVLAFFDDYML